MKHHTPKRYDPVLKTWALLLSTSIAVCLAALPGLQGSAYAAGSTCIPIAIGVPGSTLGGSAPNWYDPSPTAPPFINTLDDPRWNGSVVQSLLPSVSGGAAPQATFQALHKNEGGKEFLYLSWRATTPAIYEGNQIWVGFAAADGTAVAIQITLTVASDQTDSPATVNNTAVFSVTISTYTVQNGWLPYQPAPGQPKTPQWVTDSTRVWVADAPATWAVQMRVPSGATLDKGVNFSTDFSMWYQFDVYVPPGNNDVPFSSPTTAPTAVASPPDPTQAGNFAPWKLGGDPTQPPIAGCATEGVAIYPDDITVQNTAHGTGTTIDPTAMNTFSAKPRNYGPGVANSIVARFRLANWGNQVWLDDANVNPQTIWQDVFQSPTPVNIPAPSGGGSFGQTTIAGVRTFSFCEACQHASYYQNHKTQCDNDALCTENNTRQDHQCMLVQLSGPANFINNAAYRNMDFAGASSFSESSVVDVRAAGPSSPGNFARDVYLWVDTINMPRYYVGDGGSPSNVTFRAASNAPVRTKAPVALSGLAKEIFALPPAQQATLLRAELERGSTTYEKLRGALPTYQVRAFYDTGVRTTAHGQTVIRLQPMLPFGYFMLHQGQAQGWQVALAGAQEIGPNFYRIAVPASGVATVTNSITAVEPGPGPSPHRCHLCATTSGAGVGALVTGLALLGLVAYRPQKKK
jgi:hypothetical protein